MSLTAVVLRKPHSAKPRKPCASALEKDAGSRPPEKPL